MTAISHQIQTFFESPTADVIYNKDLDTLFLNYKGKVKNHEEFVTINSAVLEAFKKLNTQKFVADVRHMGVIGIESQNWVVNTLLAGMFEHLQGKPLYHSQFLDKKEIFAKVSASNIKSRSEQEKEGFVLTQFYDWDELVDHLKSI